MDDKDLHYQLGLLTGSVGKLTASIGSLEENLNGFRVDINKKVKTLSDEHQQRKGAYKALTVIYAAGSSLVGYIAAHVWSVP